jgi:predicted nucleic acid-binding protein
MILDTTAIQHLDRAGGLDLLQKIYEHVIVPSAVAEEIEQGRAAGVPLPELGKYSWIEVRPVKDVDAVSVKTGLGPGERAAMALAMETPGSVVVIDDPLGRRYAQMMRQSHTSTLGVLLRAKQKQLIKRVGSLLEKLESRGFKPHPTTRTAFLAFANEIA